MILQDKSELRIYPKEVFKTLVQPALTAKIDDREMFMKGFDYSYYYEQND